MGGSSTVTKKKSPTADNEDGPLILGGSSTVTKKKSPTAAIEDLIVPCITSPSSQKQCIPELDSNTDKYHGTEVKRNLSNTILISRPSEQDCLEPNPECSSDDPVPFPVEEQDENTPEPENNAKPFSLFIPCSPPKKETIEDFPVHTSKVNAPLLKKRALSANRGEDKSHKRLKSTGDRPNTAAKLTDTNSARSIKMNAQERRAKTKSYRPPIPKSTSTKAGMCIYLL